MNFCKQRTIDMEERYKEQAEKQNVFVDNLDARGFTEGLGHLLF